MISRFGKQLEFYVWGDGLTRFGVVGRIAAGMLRNLWAVLRDIMSGQLTMRAMGLVYTTLLSVVPLMAVSFSVLKGFGVHRELAQYLYGVLEPIGAKGVEITDQVMTLVDNVNGSVLGGIGLAFFVYTAISMVQKIEETFNYVWYVSKPRSFSTRVVGYTTVLIVGTLAIAIAIRIIASFGEEDLVVSMQESSVLAPVFDFLSGLTPYAVIIAIFSFLYKFLPNTNVRMQSALVGGAAGGFLWVTTSMVFGAVLSTSTNRQAIYASFAIAITTLLWLYLNWLILLIGSQIAFYFQNPAYLRIGRREPRLSNEMRERLALNVMYLVGKEFRDPKSGVDIQSIGQTLRIPTLTLEPVVEGLEHSGLLKGTEEDQLLPAREMSRIRLTDILDVVRHEGETGSHETPVWNSAISEIGKSIDASVGDTLGDITLAQFLDQQDA